MAETAQERLDRLDAAIAAIETAGIEGYSQADLRVQHLNLKTLYDRRRELLAEVAAESGDSPINYVQFPHNGRGGGGEHTS